MHEREDAHNKDDVGSADNENNDAMRTSIMWWMMT